MHFWHFKVVFVDYRIILNYSQNTVFIGFFRHYTIKKRNSRVICKRDLVFCCIFSEQTPIYSLINPCIYIVRLVRKKNEKIVFSKFSRLLAQKWSNCIENIIEFDRILLMYGKNVTSQTNYF